MTCGIKKFDSMYNTYSLIIFILMYDAIDFLSTFDHSSYLKNLYYYHLFYRDLIYHQMFFEHDINIFYLNKINSQMLIKKATASTEGYYTYIDVFICS